MYEFEKRERKFREWLREALVHLPQPPSPDDGRGHAGCLGGFPSDFPRSLRMRMM
jgi:hypothetical protein